MRDLWQSTDKCPGHFGRIELARPVIHVEYAKYIHDLLRTTCRECGRILLTDEEIEKYSKRLTKLRARWKLLADRLIERIRKKAMERTVCPHCVLSSTGLGLRDRIRSMRRRRMVSWRSWTNED